MLRSDRLLDAEVFAVDKLTVQTADGAEVGRHVVRHPGTVAIVAENALQQVALVHVFRPALNRYRWELPAGRLDPELDIEGVAKEELRSEVGVQAAQLQVVITFSTSPGH